MSPALNFKYCSKLVIGRRLAKSTLIGWRGYYGGGRVGVDRHLCGTQQTRGFDPMLFQYWPIVNGAGPALKQH